MKKPANFVDHAMVIPLFKEHLKFISLLPEAVAADAIYDCEDILRFIIDELHAQPVIPKNPRNTGKYRNLRKLSPRGTPICIAGFEMKYWGKFQDLNRIRLKFVCPITHSKKFAKQIPICPWNHPNFLTGAAAMSTSKPTPASATQSTTVRKPSEKSTINDPVPSGSFLGC